MPHYLGFLFALIALLSWGFGDFFIQRTCRLVGSWKALFFIGLAALIGLFPFVKNDLADLAKTDVLLLFLLGVVIFFAALFDFEALRRGKIAIVEPIIGLELPITVGLSLTLAGEIISPVQILLIGLIFVGVVLAVTTHHSHRRYHRRILEKGVILAGLGAVGMTLINFLVGVSSQEISPLMTIWFAHSLLVVFCGAYLIYTGEFKNLLANFKRHPTPIIGQSVLDNVAWVAFAQATTIIPIAVATAISESYIALAVLLGLLVNRERLKPHQLLGVAFAIGGVILLALEF